MIKELRRPNTFWQLAFDIDATHVRDVKGYDFDPGEFDYLSLRRGIRLKGDLPPVVRLRLEQNSKPLADFPGNALGWPIMSERLVTHLSPFIQDCVQLIPAPLFEQHSDKRVPGYFIVNVIKVLNCVDMAHSTPRFDGDRLTGFNEVCFDPAKTRGAHIFKYLVPPDKVDFSVICSYELVKSLDQKGFTGLAFLRCRSTDDYAEK